MWPRWSICLTWLAVLACPALMSGCKPSGPEVGEVTGTVTLDGKPLAGAILTFRPEGDKGTISTGGTDQDGKYRMMFTMTRAGAMLGKHDVEIVTNKLSKSEIADLKAEGKTPPEFQPVPKKYREPGALTAEVKRGSNTINFELKSGE